MYTTPFGLLLLTASLLTAAAPPTPRRHTLANPPAKLCLTPAGGKGTVRVYSGRQLVEVERIEGGKVFTILPPPGGKLRLVTTGSAWFPLPFPSK